MEHALYFCFEHTEKPRARSLLVQTRRQNHVDCSPFVTSKRVTQLMEEVEQIYTDKLECGNRTRAMQRLRVPPLEEKQPRIVTFRLGFSLGESFASALKHALLCFVDG